MTHTCDYYTHTDCVVSLLCDGVPSSGYTAWARYIGVCSLHLTCAPFIWGNLFPGRRVTRTPELPWGRRVTRTPEHPSYPGEGGGWGRANFSFIFGQTVANPSHEKQTVGLPREVACLAVTLLVGPTFLYITILSRVKSVKMRQSEHAPPLCQLLARAKGLTFLAHVSCLCWESDLLSRDFFSLYKRDLKLRTAMSG